MMHWCSVGRVCLDGGLFAKMKQHGGVFCTNMALGEGRGPLVCTKHRLFLSTESAEINGLVLTCHK